MKQLKKFLTIFLAAALILSLAACGQSGTAEGPGLTKVPEVGLNFRISQEFLDNGGAYEGANFTLDDYPLLSLYHYYTPVTDPLFEDYEDKALNSPELITEQYIEDFYAQMQTHSQCVLWMVLVPEETYEARIADGDTMEEIGGGIYGPMEEYGRNSGYVYLLSIPEMELTGCTDVEIAEYERCKASVADMLDSFQFTQVTAAEEITMADAFPAFETLDLNKTTVTNDIFAGKDLTVLNIWGTFCTPCIQEMPELGQWSKEMPKNVQLIGLVTDIAGEDDTEHWTLAQTILEKAGAEFTNLVVNEDFSDIMNAVVGVPTTIFVDSEGNIVGEPIVGADVAGYQSFVEAYLHE